VLVVGDSLGHILEFFAFDRTYVDRLRNGDPAVEQHFFAYFEPFLNMMLRSRSIPPDQIEDITQETFTRVLVQLRKDGIRQPERFGAFVCTTCKNVLRERNRSHQKDGNPLDDSHYEIPDKAIDLDRVLATKELMVQVREIMKELSPREVAILRAIFWEEKDKDEVCREFAIDRNYLRVCFLRAKDKFRSHYEKRQRPKPPTPG
jgi:RNA polymerase sigma-70 factor (ECF subfamily)